MMVYYYKNFGVGVGSSEHLGLFGETNNHTPNTNLSFISLHIFVIMQDKFFIF